MQSSCEQARTCKADKYAPTRRRAFRSTDLGSEIVELQLPQFEQELDLRPPKNRTKKRDLSHYSHKSEGYCSLDCTM